MPFRGSFVPSNRKRSTKSHETPRNRNSFSARAVVTVGQALVNAGSGLVSIYFPRALIRFKTVSVKCEPYCGER